MPGGRLPAEDSTAPPPMPPRLISLLTWRWSPGVLIGHGAARAQANLPEPLVLDDAHPVVKVWSALRLLRDPAGRLTVADAAARIAHFQAMPSPVGSLGPRRDGLWMHQPLRTAGRDGRWMPDIDHPVLNEVQVCLLTLGHGQALPRLGSTQPFASRPMPRRSPALTLSLQPGRHRELLLRVKTECVMVLPITLIKRSGPRPCAEKAGTARPKRGIWSRWRRPTR
jgi:hypothetical protein